MKTKGLTIFILFISSLSSFGQLTLQDSLLAHFPFSGNALDASGNNNHGIIYGATPTTDRFGNANSAYSFDGINDEIILFNAFQGNQPAVNYMTVTGWFKTNSAKPASTIISQHTGCSNGSTDDYLLIHITNYNTNNHLIANMYYHNPGVKVDESQVTDNSWHYFAYVYDNATARLYIDGILKDQKTVSLSSNFSYPSNNNWVIGNYHYNGCPTDVYFEGALDDIRIYNRALSSAEVQNLYLGTPTANFMITDNDDCDLSVPFTNQSSNATTYQWSFGDGNTSTNTSPTHQYTSSGTYTVTLEAFNSNNDVDTFTQVVNITDSLIANYGYSSQLVTGTSIQFSDSSNGAITDWYWDFDNGLISTLPNPSIIYANAGTYNVQLIVTNDIGCQDTITKVIEVESSISTQYTSNDISIALFPNPTSGQLNLSYKGKASNNNDIQVIISDASGKVIKEYYFGKVDIEWRTTILLNHLANGVYFFKINEYKDGQIKNSVNRKIILQH